ncbi:MAG TPA: zf-HC2 domain-containing protein [Candidatus Binatia bacterium]|nr:zf-HC2 domain-containing protein [Candidatus Binatia bacterium]
MLEGGGIAGAQRAEQRTLLVIRAASREPLARRRSTVEDRRREIGAADENASAFAELVQQLDARRIAERHAAEVQDDRLAAVERIATGSSQLGGRFPREPALHVEGGDVVRGVGTRDLEHHAPRHPQATCRPAGGPAFGGFASPHAELAVRADRGAANPPRRAAAAATAFRGSATVGAHRRRRAKRPETAGDPAASQLEAPDRHQDRQGAGWPSAMTCRELNDLLADYLGRELPSAVRSRVDAHLLTCRPCVAYVRSYEQTVRELKAMRDGLEERLPQSAPPGLVDAVLDTTVRASRPRRG